MNHSLLLSKSAEKKKVLYILIVILLVVFLYNTDNYPRLFQSTRRPPSFTSTSSRSEIEQADEAKPHHIRAQDSSSEALSMPRRGQMEVSRGKVDDCPEQVTDSNAHNFEPLPPSVIIIIIYYYYYNCKTSQASINAM